MTEQTANALDRRLAGELARLEADGVYKRLNHIQGPQGARVHMEGRGEIIVLSSNNYLGLANDPVVVQAAHSALDRYGAGTASVPNALSHTDSSRPKFLL